MSAYGSDASSMSSSSPSECMAIDERGLEMEDFEEWDDDNEPGEDHMRQTSNQNASGSVSRSQSLHFNDRVDTSHYRDCLICWEEQFQRQQSADGASGMVSKLGHFHEVIFGLERSLRTHQNDEIIFQSMLDLRRKLVEEHLESTGYHFTRWTMDMLRKHYNPLYGHRFDPEREAAQDLQQLRRLATQLEEDALYRVNPETGASTIDLRVADLLLKVSRRRTEVVRALNTMVNHRSANVQAHTQQLVRTIREVAGLPNAQDAAAAAASGNPGDEGSGRGHMINAYEIGGF